MSWLLKSKKSKKVKEFDEKVDEILASLSTEQDDRQPGTSEKKRIPEDNFLTDFSNLLENLRLIKDENDVEQRKIRNEKAEKELERIKELLVESATEVEDALPKDSEDLELERRLDDLKRSREEQLMRIREEREKLEKKSEAEYADLLKKLQSQSKSFHCLGVSSQACSQSDPEASKRPESPKIVMEQRDSEATSEDESESASPMDWERLLEIIRSDSEDDYSDDSDDSDSSYESSDSEDEPEEESEASLEEVPLNPAPPTFESSLYAIISSLKESKVSGEAQLNDHLQLNEENFVKDMGDCLQKEEEFLQGFRRISDKKEPN